VGKFVGKNSRVELAHPYKSPAMWAARCGYTSAAKVAGDDHETYLDLVVPDVCVHSRVICTNCGKAEDART
jgi:hypothetical protein